MQSTLLSNLLSDMDVHKDISNQEEQYKVRALDSGIREMQRHGAFPWNLIKGSLRVFQGVDLYPVATGHDELAFIENSKAERYSEMARFYNTSIKQFIQNVNSQRNLISDVWDQGTKMLGVKYKEIGTAGVTLDNAEDADNYTTSDDAGTAVVDKVFYKSGNSSIKIPVVNSADVATIDISFTSQSETDYKQNYEFFEVYFPSVPTSVDLKFGNNTSNYIKRTITKQFSGQAFKAGDWNILAFDLNDPGTEVGTLDSSAFDYSSIVLNGAATGSYYIGKSDLKRWELMDYWYYSFYNVLTTGATTPDRKYFLDTDGVYSTDASLVGETEWADVVKYIAMETLMAEIENRFLFSLIMRKKTEAIEAFNAKYPDMIPVIITQNHRFLTDFNQINQ